MNCAADLEGDQLAMDPAERVDLVLPARVGRDYTLAPDEPVPPKGDRLREVGGGQVRRVLHDVESAP